MKVELSEFLDTIKRWSIPITIVVYVLSFVAKLHEYVDRLGFKIVVISIFLVLLAWVCFAWNSKQPSKIYSHYLMPRFGKGLKVGSVLILVFALIPVWWTLIPAHFTQIRWFQTAEIIFLPGDFDINVRNYDWNVSKVITVDVRVEIRKGNATMLRKCEIVHQDIDPHPFAKDIFLTPEVKVLRVTPNDLAIGEDRKSSIITIDFDSSALIVEGTLRAYPEKVNRQKCGELKIKVFYKVGTKELFEILQIPMYLVS